MGLIDVVELNLWFLLFPKWSCIFRCTVTGYTCRYMI